MKNNVIHSSVAWYLGAFQKTTLATCGKRVAVKAVGEAVSCPGCNAVYASVKALKAKLAAEKEVG